MSTPIHLGLSTCPNDTFLIHGLVSGAVDPRGLDIRIEFADVQELNEGLLAGRFDACKASYALALGLGEQLCALNVGSALGFGVGPMLLARSGWDGKENDPRLLCPGAQTTATLLLRLFHPEWSQPEQVVFSEIMPALIEGRADLGVCIHEGRFTYADHGLSCLEDLGTTWEVASGHPLPLGGIFARLSLDPATVNTLQGVLGESLAYGLAHPEATLPTMSKHAQEFSPQVLMQHVDLYVNDWTRHLGSEGRAAIAVLDRRARAAGWIGA
ncbi:MAG: 1,4-dihydroxy-6-naphthoate synthase, partial [Planctomycetota bacterium]|nr:1,4-dihydroxy-6-naphthoate synthase [Planctomycetota bacterium]